MPHLIWSPPAVADIQRLYRFLAKKDKSSASRAVKAIRSDVKILAHQPEAGRPIENMDPFFREWVINFGSSGYIALYHFDGKQVTILAVRHQKEVDYQP